MYNPFLEFSNIQFQNQALAVSSDQKRYLFHPFNFKLSLVHKLKDYHFLCFYLDITRALRKKKILPILPLAKLFQICIKNSKETILVNI